MSAHRDSSVPLSWTERLASGPLARPGSLLTAALLSALLAGACAESTTPEPPDGSWALAGNWAGQIVIVRDATAPLWPRDPVTIHAVAVRGDSLELNVSFGGGCSDHAFLLLADAAWAESYPVQIGVRLAHDRNGDTCKALLSRVLRFDLSPLKAAYEASYHSRTGTVRLNVRDASSVTYSW